MGVRIPTRWRHRVLRRSEGRLTRIAYLIPFILASRVSIERGGHGTPARVTGEDVFFFMSGFAVLRLRWFSEAVWLRY